MWKEEINKKKSSLFYHLMEKLRGTLSFVTEEWETYIKEIKQRKDMIDAGNWEYIDELRALIKIGTDRWLSYQKMGVTDTYLDDAEKNYLLEVIEEDKHEIRKNDYKPSTIFVLIDSKIPRAVELWLTYEDMNISEEFILKAKKLAIHRLRENVEEYRDEIETWSFDAIIPDLLKAAVRKWREEWLSYEDMDISEEFVNRRDDL